MTIMKLCWSVMMLPFVTGNPAGRVIQIDDDKAYTLQRCHSRPADVHFLLDGSSSMRKHDFFNQRQFLTDIVSAFEIAPDKIRVGVSVYSHTYRLQFGFDKYSTKERLLEGIMNITQLSGATDTATAIEIVRTQEFKEDVVRTGVAHVLVVITDGQSRDLKATARQASITREKGISIFAIGVGTEVEMEELRNIASEADDKVSDYVFNVSNFDTLETIRNVLLLRTCEAVISVQLSECPVAEDIRDITFLFDSSSFGIGGTRTILTAVNDTVQSANPSKTGVRFGVTLNSCSNFQDIALSYSMPRYDFEGQFNGLEHLLVQYRYKHESSEQLPRKRMAVIIIDRDVSCKMKEEFQKLRDVAVKLRFIVVNDAEATELYPFVDQTDSDVGFTQISDIKEMLTEFVCSS